MKVATKRYLKAAGFFAFLVSIFFIVRSMGGIEIFKQTCADLKCLGKWAPAGFIVLYAAAVVLVVPGSALTAMAGALFGSFYGVVYVSIASTIGASLTFLISRYLAREFVYEKLSENKSFQKLDKMTEEYGAILVAIVRLIPLFPFSLVNYGFGLTRISFGVYVFFSWLCMIPGTILYVAGGDAIKTLIIEGVVPWRLLTVVGIIVIALYLLAKKYKSGFM